MKNKKLTAGFLALLSVAVFALGAFSVVQYRRAEVLERTARYESERAFSELCASVRGMNTAMRKCCLATSPRMTSSLCAEVYSRALAASASLAALPFSTAELERTAAFLSRSGDYAAFLLRQEALPEDAAANLAALSADAAMLDDALTALRADVAAGLRSVGAPIGEAAPLSDSFLSMESEFPDLPTLVYDGPFSTSVADRVPVMLEGAAELTEEDAVRCASGFLGVRSNVLQCEGTAEGKLPVWRISDGTGTVAVTRAGGYILRAVKNVSPVRCVLTVEDALRCAEDFLAAHGMGSMRESYHILEDCVLTATFCYERDGVLFYPDMVKVSVAMDTGEILWFDAEAYLTSHTERVPPAPTLTEEDARAMLPAGLTLLSERLAVIPSAGAEERFCRELTCETEGGQHCLLYYSAETGEQERILLLLEDENGTLAL